MPSNADYTYSSYPHNVVPQIKSANSGSSPGRCLGCPPDTSMQVVMFEDSSLVVVKGWETKSKVDLREFFVPVNNYLEYEVVLRPMGPDESITLSYGMLSDDDGNVPFVAILPVWNLTDLEFEEMSLNWRWKGYVVVDDYNDNSIPDNIEDGDPYTDGYDIVNYNWEQIYKIFMISATADKPLKPIELQNRTPVDVTCKILIGR